MLRLLLLRHAKSSWDDNSLTDHDRPLAKRGRKAAPRMGRAMADKGYVPDLIICSTALRTRQTLELVLPALREHREPEIRFDGSIYEAAPQSLEGYIRSLRDEASTLMLIGHSPGMHMLALLLSDNTETPDRRRLETKFPTAALAALEFTSDNWADIRVGDCRLLDFITPKLLEEQH